MLLRYHMLYKIERGKINGIPVPLNSLIITVSDKISIRLLGDSVPFIIGMLEDFCDLNEQRFVKIEDFLLYLDNNLNITTVNSYSTRIDSGVTYTYIGEVAIGSYTTTNTAIWKIKRITNATGDTVWANASQSFDQIWDNRATTIIYS